MQLTEICEKHRLKLVKAELEPLCWRGYQSKDGRPATLKPDLFAVAVGEAASGKYEDSWFIEVDLATMSLPAITEKCRRYTQYYKSGGEQKRTGVFPLVVWLAPTAARHGNLRRCIADSKELSPKNIFTVITPDEFTSLILGDDHEAAAG